MHKGRLRIVLAMSLAGVLNAPSGAAEFVPGANKTRSTFYDAQRRAVAQTNIERFDWARTHRDEVIKAARPWLDTSDVDLWRMVHSWEVPRAIGVNRDLGCPCCGRAIYGEGGSTLYAFTGTPKGHPWKVQCPNCNELFPKNDFLAFYQSGISTEDGFFHYAQADRALLYNADHPDPNDPLHLWCVDDGHGWQDANGGLHLFIATYMYRGAWRIPISQLAEAYALTEDPAYAHKCLILLDRLADMYPNLEGRNGQLINFAPGAYWDGIFGPNYWAGGAWVGLAMAYDQVYDGLDRVPDAVEFVRDRSRQFKVPSSKESLADIKHHIEDRLFLDRFSKPGSYQMNGTISQMCEAKVDLVLRGEKAINEFVDVHLPRIVPPRCLNDDGSGNERSISYDGGAFGNYCDLLVELADLDRGLAIKCIQQYPKLRAAFDFWPDIWCIDKYLPNIGDSSFGPGNRSDIPGRPAPYLRLFDLTDDPRYAQIAVMAAGGDRAKMPRSIWQKDPETLIDKAFDQARAMAGWYTPSLVKKDYKLGLLRTGRGHDALALWLFYSPAAGTSSHSHFDALNFGLFAFGQSVVCEQGYPLFTGDWPSRWEWTSHTRSHATVTVDGQCQKQCDGGRLLGFAGQYDVQMISAESPCVYDQTSVYRRTLLLVETAPGRNVLIDVFRVRGGRTHTYTVPFFYGRALLQGLDLQEAGEMYEGYVENVRRARADQGWTLDAEIQDRWQGCPTGRVRVYGAPGDYDVLLGEAETRLGDECPERLPYLFLQRSGNDEGLTSTFVLVCEPYEGPVPESLMPAWSITDEHVAIHIEPESGRTYDFTVLDADPEGTVVDVARAQGNSATRFRLSGTEGPHEPFVMNRQVRKTLTLPYLVHLPAGYSGQSTKRWPLILFLHGAGERGDDLSKVADLGPLGRAGRQADFPFIVVAPQCPLGTDWSAEALNALLDEVVLRYAVDTDRVYLTGFSMGGMGTWETAMRYTHRFAAIAPLCGRATPLLCGNLWRMPIWVFHGDKDDVVPIRHSADMVEFIKGMGNEKVKYTVYPDADHVIWPDTYNNADLYVWFLNHKRSDRE